MGCFNFQEGFYAYTGSALGDGGSSLRRRVARHLEKRKSKHWHIDFLLANKNARVTAVVAAESSVKKECQINNLIENIEGATIPVLGFGASDCKQNCRSHFVYFGKENVEKKIVDAYAHFFKPERMLYMSWSFSTTNPQASACPEKELCSLINLSETCGAVKQRYLSFFTAQPLKIYDV